MLSLNCKYFQFKDNISVYWYFTSNISMQIQYLTNIGNSLGVKNSDDCNIGVILVQNKTNNGMVLT